MNENEVYQATYRNVISISWLIMLSVSILLIFISLLFFKDELWYKLSLSYLLGAMTNIFAFNLLKNNIANISSNTKNVISGSFSNYLVRLMIYGFVLFISFNNDKLNPYIVLSGFLTVRIAIYIYSWIKRKE